MKIPAIDYPEPRANVGDRFTYRTGKQAHAATITGYHVEHNTDTHRTTVQYRGVYTLGDQQVTITIPLSIVDRQLVTQEG